MQSKRLYPSVSSAAHDRLAECAVEHDVVKEDETPKRPHASLTKYCYSF